MNPEFKTSRSIETIPEGQEKLDSFIEHVNHEIEEEIKRLQKEGELVGEGKAARVFDVPIEGTLCQVCAKIWRPDVLKMAENNVVEYKKRQYLSPEEEFLLQDRLYMEGYRNIPRVFVFGSFGEYKVMSMEKIPGYTLAQIEAAGARIIDPSWQDLEKLVVNLNRNHNIAHRDLHTGNIILKTDQSLSDGAELSGELFVIDFGLSKKVLGMPTAEDYELTVGNNVIKYRRDFASIDEVKPRRNGDPESIFARLK